MIELQNVRKSFDAVQAVDNVSAAIEEGHDEASVRRV